MPFEVFVGGELDTKLPDPSREYVLQFKLFRKRFNGRKTFKIDSDEVEAARRAWQQYERKGPKSVDDVMVGNFFLSVFNIKLSFQGVHAGTPGTKLVESRSL